MFEHFLWFSMDCQLMLSCVFVCFHLICNAFVWLPINGLLSVFYACICFFYWFEIISSDFQSVSYVFLSTAYWFPMCSYDFLSTSYRVPRFSNHILLNLFGCTLFLYEPMFRSYGFLCVSYWFRMLFYARRLFPMFFLLISVDFQMPSYVFLLGFFCCPINSDEFLLFCYYDVLLNLFFRVLLFS